MKLFVFQCYPICYFGNFISFALDIVRNERVKFQKKLLDALVGK